MLRQFDVRVIFEVMVTLTYVLQFYRDPGYGTGKRFILRFAYTIAHCLFWLAGKRLQKHLSYFVPVFYLLVFPLVLFDTQDPSENLENNQQSLGSQQLLRLSFNFLFCATLLSPSANMVIANGLQCIIASIFWWYVFSTDEERTVVSSETVFILAF